MFGAINGKEALRALCPGSYLRDESCLGNDHLVITIHAHSTKGNFNSPDTGPQPEYEILSAAEMEAVSARVEWRLH